MAKMGHIARLEELVREMASEGLGICGHRERPCPMPKHETLPDGTCVTCELLTLAWRVFWARA